MVRETEKISVIIPIYNTEKYLEKCINSVISQTYENWELLLIDDGSTDNSGIVCDAFAKKDARIVVKHQENKGRSAARNKGLEIATGQYIMFVDSDDWVDDRCLELSYQAVVEYNFPLVVFRNRHIYTDHIEDESDGQVCVFEGEESLEFYVKGKEGLQRTDTVWGKLYHKDLLHDIRFVEDKYYEDLMFITKVFSKCVSCVYLNQAFYNYNVGTETSITYLGVNELTFRDEIPIFYEKESYLKELGRADLAEHYAFFMYQRIITYYVECVDAKRKDYAKRLSEYIYVDRDKVKQLVKRYGTKYYKIYFSLFLFHPQLGYFFKKIIDKL